MTSTSTPPEYLEELSECRLCEWECGVNRLAGELGVCRMGRPAVASRTLHPAPPESYTVFTAGCNFRCLHCQNWDIAHFPDSEARVDGWLKPGELGKEAVGALNSARGRIMSADRIFFSGGSPTCSLPYIEEVVRQARNIDPATKVNFDTNGFMTTESLHRILDLTTSITYDLRARDDEVHREITGAPVEPVLRNARTVGENPDKLWEFRILVIPGINQNQVRPLSKFIASIDPDLPVSFLAFRPNFVLEDHPGATIEQMDQAVAEAEDVGLGNVDWAGRPGLPGHRRERADLDLADAGSRQAAAYSLTAGCQTHPRDCGHCPRQDRCPVKRHTPANRT